ncbi:MAG: tRNA (adenosine(37)-N6)-dimethylallyltransferase MiaA [Bacteroidales bacterium]|jgi:tRNA dimethylallyltransferase
MNVPTQKYTLLAILGATAGGKTSVAVHAARKFNGEIISADSRQLYKGMDLGTGKDLDEYFLDGELVPYHLIDIKPAGYQYNVFEYQQDFVEAYKDIHTRGKFPVLCGGSGLYLQSVLGEYKLIKVPVDPVLRKELEDLPMEKLEEILSRYRKLHNTTDIDTRKRAIRAIEIEKYQSEYGEESRDFPELHPLLVGVKFDRESRRRRITERLKQRLKEGMIEEVEALLNQGVTPEQLMYYGLEYKYLTLYLTGKMDYETFFKKLEVAIHQFAKRQMTWFRRMERQGFHIHWLDGYMPMEEKLAKIEQWLNE